jgi:AraC family transcriptional activator of pobA
MKSTFPLYDICTLSNYQEEDILISRFAPYLEKHKNLHLAHKHSFYHLVMFTKGEGTHTIDFNTFNIKPYQVYFMVPGQVHSWAFTGAMDGYIINFSSTFFNSFLLNNNYLELLPFFSGNIDDAVINPPKEVQRPLVDIFEAIIQETANIKNFGADMVRVLMLQLFMSLSRLNTGAGKTIASPYNYTLLKSFQKLIAQNFVEIRLPKQYASLLYITPNHLNAVCKDILGIPAGQVIRNRIILEAKRLLINLDLTITEIAARLNFADNSYFARFFKKEAGLSPDEFRKKQIK